MTTTLTEIFLHSRQRLIRRVRRIVWDPQIAEDLAQETYIRAAHAARTGTVEQMEAYLHRTARNLALDHLRRRQTRAAVERPETPDHDIRDIAADQPAVDDRLAAREELDHVRAALSRLPERAQKVVVLARIEGWSNARIARHLDISERTVFNDLKLALAHCRDALARLERK
ncbi:RNA polymerase sigma factor [Tistrella mobilis]|uniref:RNA polymerase sigma factor n=1 Tax=Tistrella mobilis TaxID=171437 RepID=UPI0035578981